MNASVGVFNVALLFACIVAPFVAVSLAHFAAIPGVDSDSETEVRSKIVHAGMHTNRFLHQILSMECLGF